MLSVSIKHPDSEAFIDAKMTEGKITGANVSVKIDDEFMRCATEDREYVQQFPIDSATPQVTKGHQRAQAVGEDCTQRMEECRARRAVLGYDNTREHT